MPKGQAQTTWFPELKVILENRWNSKMSIIQHFDLVDDLNKALSQIRTDLNIQPPMMWCPNCQKRHRSKFTDISITAMYYALKRFELCDKDEFNKLQRDWKKYSTSENIDIYGKKKTDRKITINKD
ncbi:MAG TPA: hypothetical protein VEP89_04800 [Draconibacterium sp.]|nr:hypothetical protein [Draconibacterium sp.]